MSQKFYIGVGAILKKDNKVLLVRRSPNIYGGGLYSFPGGHVDGDEAVRHALARELNEELGITINPGEAEFVHVSHRKADGREYVHFLFVVHAWQGDIFNKEPDRHDEVAWFAMDQLPKSLTFDVAGGLQVYREKIYFSELGWE